MQRYKKSNQGFTLLEILLVVGIIAILAGIVIVAINPSKQLATVRNTERKSDIKQIDSALQQYYIDNFHYPYSLTNSLTEICDTGSQASSSELTATCNSAGLVNLSELVPTYIVAVPKDPQATGNGTGYEVMQNPTTKKLITVASHPELGQTIAIGTTTASTTGGGDTLGDGLVAHYKMNDTDGTTVVDSTSNHYDGSGTYTHATGHVGSGALSFDGTSDSVDFTGLSVETSYTIAFWINLSATLDVWYLGDSSSRDIAFQTVTADQYHPAGMQFYWQPGASGGYMVLPSNFSNSWNHFAVTVNNGLASTYVNGVNIERDVSITTYGFSSLTIGSLMGGGYNFPGKFDDFRIYNRALTQDEITALAAGTEAE